MSLFEQQQKRREALAERLSIVADLACQTPFTDDLGDVAYDLLRQAAAQIASDRHRLAALTQPPETTPVSGDEVERVALALLNDDRARNGWPAADALSHLADHDADAYRSSARAAIAALVQSPGDEVEAAAARLIDQSDEPSWIAGNYSARMNYWRDKAIEVADSLRAIVAINAAPSDGVTIPAGWRLVPIEPTEAMLDAGQAVDGTITARDVYVAMLTASPAPPVSQTEGVERLLQGMLNQRWASSSGEWGVPDWVETDEPRRVAEQILAALTPSGATEQGEGDRFANDAAAKALYDTWSHMPGWVPWVERGNSDMQERARREVML